MGFREYESRPITRTAYQVRSDDHIQGLGEGQYMVLVDGKPVYFKAYETIFPGDFIVYLADDDIYHCREAVFRERNVVN